MTNEIDEQTQQDEYESRPGRFDGWERVNWIIAASRFIGVAVIVFGLANTIDIANKSFGGIGSGQDWLQWASLAAGSTSTGLLLIVAAEILNHLLGRDSESQ